MSETPTPEIKLGTEIEAAAETVPAVPAVEAAPEPEVQVAAKPKYGFWWGTGRRKASVARVRIKPGDGQFQINKRSIESYFTEVQDQEDMQSALKATKTLGSIDVFVNVNGGGHTGQAGAIVLGLARALKEYDPALELSLRKQGYLTVDSRRVERKKYGQRGARRRFQFSKR
jgi:small subunit ribosomal protein S9